MGKHPFASGVGVACGLLCVALQSHAQPAPAVPPRAAGEYFHDGVYVRLAAGASYLRDKFEMKGDSLLFGNAEGTVTGFGQAHEIIVGGAVAPGLILAGGFFTDIARTTSVEQTGDPVQPKEAYAMFTMGPIVDYYVDPLAGLHFQLGGGLGVVSSVQPEGSDGGSGSGYGLVGGVGYEAWIARQWSMGALLRLQYVSARETPLSLFSDLSIEHRALGLALMFTATLN